MEPFIGQLMLFGGNFAPRGWALCEGQLLPIANYSALFSILGTTYGGDGKTTFALPDLRGRVPMGFGRGPGLSSHVLGAKGGEENVTLTTAQIPSHNHQAMGSNADGNAPSPAEGTWGVTGSTTPPSGPYVTTAPNVAMNSAVIANTGGGQAHDNMQPYIAMNWCIALVGIFPSRG